MDGSERTKQHCFGNQKEAVLRTGEARLHCEMELKGKTIAEISRPLEHGARTKDVVDENSNYKARMASLERQLALHTSANSPSGTDSHGCEKEKRSQRDSDAHSHALKFVQF